MMRKTAIVLRLVGVTTIMVLTTQVALGATAATATLDLPSKAIDSGPLSATTTLLDPSGTFGTATASPGLLKAEIISKGVVATALATFDDSITLIGSPGTTARLHITELLDGTLSVGVNGGQARVLAALFVTGAGFLGAQAQYEKTQQFGVPPLESGSLDLIVNVPIGTFELLSQLNANATGSLVLPSTSDYASTDRIFITSLTPGVTITSLSNHNYALVPEPSSAVVLLFGFAVILLIALRRRAHGRLLSFPASSLGSRRDARRNR